MTRGFFCHALVVVLVAYGARRVSTVPPTDHWRRCYQIMMKNWTRPCTKNQRMDSTNCFAAKTDGNAPMARCSNITECPDPPTDVNVEYYNESLFIDDRDVYTGVNVSWTFNSQGSVGHERSFKVVLQLATQNYYMALINVTWTAAEVDENGMVTVSYDCFYPIESDDTWIEVTVYPIPYMYKDQAYTRKAFQTPHHKQTLKKEQHTTTNESDVNPDGNVSTVKNVPQTTRGPVLDITPMQVIQKSTTMTVIIVILSIFSVAFVCLGVLLGVFYKCHQPWRIHKDPIQVFLVFGEDSVKHQKKCRSLGTYLARTVPCRVRYMSDYATELALGTAVNSAHFILVVTSETVTNALHDEAPGTHLAACMQLVRNQLSKNIMLFFGRTKPSDGFRWLSDKEPISVDTALEDLKKYLRGTDDSLKDIGDSASATHSVVEHLSVSQLLTPFRDTQFLVPEQPSAFRSREVQGQHSLSHNVRGPISYPDPVCSSQTGSNFVSRCGSLVQSVNESVVT